MLPADGLAGAAWFTSVCRLDVVPNAFSVPLLSPAVPLPTAIVAAAVREIPVSVAPTVTGPSVVIPAPPPTETMSLVVLLSPVMSAVLALFRKATATSVEVARRTPVIAGFALLLMKGAAAAEVRQLPPEALRHVMLPVVLSP